MGSVKCSICSAGADASNAVNEALSKGDFLQTIAASFGFSKSAIHRHKRGKCENSFPLWKAAKIRARREKVSGCRIVTRWHGLEGGTEKGPERITAVDHSRFTVDTRFVDVAPSDIRGDDIVLDVVFDKPKPPRRRPEVLIPEPSQAPAQGT